MKPSPYFKDSFRYFFKRFCSERRLAKWFLKRSGGESPAFVCPADFAEFKRTLVFLPSDAGEAKRILEFFRPLWNKENALGVAWTKIQEPLLHFKNPAKMIFLGELDFRFGERLFEDARREVLEFAPDLCLYFAEPFLPALYLARVSGAVCRVGFSAEEFYPFLNVSFNAGGALAQIQKRYGGLLAR